MEEKKRKVLPLVVILLGVVFLGLGVYRGEHKMVEAKSNIICLECIGIG